MLPSNFVEQKFVPHSNAGQIEEILARAAVRTPSTLCEFEAYDLFSLLGVALPAYKYFSLAELAKGKEWIAAGKNYVVKCHIPGCLHKTDIGGVMLFVNRENYDEKTKGFVAALQAQKFDLEGIIIVEMVSFYTSGMSGGELLLSSFNDTSFGPSICFGLGGTAIEYYGKIMEKSQAFLPVFLDFDSKIVQRAIEDMPCT